MGTRINFIFRNDSTSGVCAVLYCNNSHGDINPVEIVRTIGHGSLGPTSAMAELLSVTYPSDGGNNKAGVRVFSLDGSMGDNEAVYECHWRYSSGTGRNVTFVMKKRPQHYRPLDLPLMERGKDGCPVLHIPSELVDIRTTFFDDVKQERTDVTIGLHGALTVTFADHGDHNSDDDALSRPVIMAEVFDGVARCSVWGDINKESATHSIHLDGARLSERRDVDADCEQSPEVA